MDANDRISFVCAGRSRCSERAIWSRTVHDSHAPNVLAVRATG